jgi:hypothetical protein
VIGKGVVIGARTTIGPHAVTPKKNKLPLIATPTTTWRRRRDGRLRSRCAFRRACCLLMAYSLDPGAPDCAHKKRLPQRASDLQKRG